MDIYPKDIPKQDISIKLSGRWHGTSGTMDPLSEDSIVFNAADRMFFLYHKRPIIEYATSKITHLYANKEYVIQLTGAPGFAVMMFPKYLAIRTHEGQLFVISKFVLSKGPGHGWCYATFTIN
jgi:hypothetical protein